MREFPRPRVIVSKCIEFEPCRYNGVMIPSPVVEILKDLVEFSPVCPEVEIGLGVPRKPIRIVATEGELRLVQPESGRDVTAEMKEFAESYLGTVRDVDGFILKFRSPSCGMKDVKIHRSIEKAAPVSKGAGFFGGAVTERFSHLAVEDEGRLKNYRIREHFLTKLFTLARFREIKHARMMAELVRFHTESKFLLMAYSQKELKLMGKIVANPDKRSVEDVLEDYETHLQRALTSAPGYTSSINVLMHAMGYFSRQLSPREKAFFLDSLEDYRARQVPLSVPVGIMKSYVVRFEEQYLMKQRFFEPFPESLITVTDSGKGRDL
jgi:uncharacterized protein YbgA (DUF1722 family)/uncharacterized protein YbbK (DUF523 family)